MAQRFDLLIKAKTAGEAGIKRMGNSMQGLQGRLKNVRMAALSVNTAFKAMAVILTAGAFTRVITGAINQADAFGKLSRQTGVAADTLQSYVNAGKLAGVEQATIEKSLRRLAQSQRKADQGIKTYSESYEALGISVRNTDGDLKPSEVLLGDIADRFADMPNGATKSALAMEIFGRSGAKMIPMLNEGSEALEKWNYETSEGFAANAEYFNDQLTMLSFGFDGFRKQLADALLPALNAIGEEFRALFNSQNDWEALFYVIEAGLRTISATVYSLVAAFNFLSRTIVDIFKILNEARKFNFEGMKDIAGKGLKDTREQFGTDMSSLGKIITGKSEAGDQYGFNKGTKDAKALASQLKKTFGGAMRSKVESFAETVGDFGSQVGDVVVKSFKGLEDQLVSFVTTGKMEFKKLAQSIIADMARIAIRAAITKPLMGMFGFAKGGAFQNGNQITAYAKGGVVNSPTMFAMGGQGNFGIMGEGGQPEAIMPLKRGKGGRLGVEASGNNSSVVVNVDASGGTEVSGNAGQAAMLGEAVAAAVRTQIANERRPGGLLYA